MADSMVIDGVFASEAIDSSGEILSIEGADISDLENGVGVLNFEHKGSDENGSSFNDIIGKVVFAKKIFAAKDCSNDRERMYWDRVKLPLIYGKCRLFDGSGHPGAIAAAAIIRDSAKNNEPLIVRFSIEGSTLEREGNTLKTSICRRVAATIKPCNRTAVSGLLEDPNGDTSKEKLESVEDDLKGLVNKKSEHPLYMRLGGTLSFEGNPLIEESVEKTLSAGSYDVAPSALSGGSALQVEDRSLRMRTMKAQAQAALRDWDRSGTFKSFLKSRMPEVDESFIDKFSEMVDDYTLKLKKADEEGDTSFDFGANAPPAKEEAGSKGSGRTAYDKNQPLTFRGEKLKKNPKLKAALFDEAQGVLHTPEGSFHLYHPGRDPHYPDALKSFHEILSNSQTLSNGEKMHDYAVRNWLKVHHALKEGRLPEAIPAASFAFSMLSPNTPVPVHEMMFGHLVDSIKEMGFDLRSPLFATKEMERDWKGRDRPTGTPQHSKDYFENDIRSGIILGNDSVGGDRKAGENASFMLANSKYGWMAQYNELHKKVKDLISRHGTDTQGAVAELMQRRMDSDQWENQRRAAASKGKEDPGPFPGWAIPGILQKTGRFAYSMLGGGNSFVPDTHFTRHLFGLDKNQDANSLAYLKDKVVWAPGQSHVLNAMDRWYLKNHPAVQYMLNHPEFGKYFKDDPSQAVFPSFWGHWLAIGPHENALGYGDQGFSNARASHRPLFDFYDDLLANPDENTPERQIGMYPRPLTEEQAKQGILDPRVPRNPYRAEFDPVRVAERKKKERAKKRAAAKKLGKAEDDFVHEDYEAPPESEHMTPHEAALLTHEFAEKHGEAAASMMYYTHIIPKLWPGIHEEPMPPVHQEFSPQKLALSLQSAVIDLRKAVYSLSNPEELVKAEPVAVPVEEPAEITFNGKKSRPGIIQGLSSQIRGRKFHVVHDDGDKLYIIPHELGGRFGHDDVRSIAKKSVGKSYTVLKAHQPLSRESVVDSTRHGVNLFMPEQHNLIHGLDFNQSETETPSHATEGYEKDRWMKAADGRLIYVKTGSDVPRESAYHELAHRFFGMGQHLPVVAQGVHPETKEPFVAIDGIPDAEHIDEDDIDPRHAFILDRLSQSGELDKMAIMDRVLGNQDRHSGNMIFGDRGMFLIDHGAAFHGLSGESPAYYDRHAQSKTGNATDADLMRVHPDAIRWLQQLDPLKLNDWMRNDFRKLGYWETPGRALRSLQDLAAKNPVMVRQQIWRGH